MLRVLEKQSNHLFFGATYSWDKLDNALNHSHLPSSTKKFAKKLGVKAGDVSKAPVPFLPKRRPPYCLVHTHMDNQSAANGFRRPGSYNGYNNSNGTPC